MSEAPFLMAWKNRELTNLTTGADSSLERRSCELRIKSSKSDSTSIISSEVVSTFSKSEPV